MSFPDLHSKAMGMTFIYIYLSKLGSGGGALRHTHFRCASKGGAFAAYIIVYNFEF